VKLDGLKAISVELARLWGREQIGESSVSKYLVRATDPMPHLRVASRIYVDQLELEQWAARQVHRQEPKPAQPTDLRQLSLLQDFHAEQLPQVPQLRQNKKAK
jgi:hypothetical protein